MSKKARTRWHPTKNSLMLGEWRLCTVSRRHESHGGRWLVHLTLPCDAPGISGQSIFGDEFPTLEQAKTHAAQRVWNWMRAMGLDKGVAPPQGWTDREPVPLIGEVKRRMEL